MLARHAQERSAQVQSCCLPRPLATVSWTRCGRDVCELVRLLHSCYWVSRMRSGIGWHIVGWANRRLRCTCGWLSSCRQFVCV